MNLYVASIVMVIIISIIIALSLALSFLSFRTKWVFKEKISFDCNIFVRSIIACIKDEDSAYELNDLLSNMFIPYNNMILKFWIWDISRFIKDTEKYKYVIKGIVENKELFVLVYKHFFIEKKEPNIELLKKSQELIESYKNTVYN